MQIAHWFLLCLLLLLPFFLSDFIAKLAIISSSMLTASACESVFQAFYRPLNYELVALLAITYNNYNFYYAAGETTRSWSSASHTHTSRPTNQIKRRNYGPPMLIYMSKYWNFSAFLFKVVFYCAARRCRAKIHEPDSHLCESFFMVSSHRSVWLPE